MFISVVLFSIGCSRGGGGEGEGGFGSTQILNGVGSSISGKVYDNGVVASILAKINSQTVAGNPLSGAEVYLEEVPGNRVQSGADGSFTLVDVPSQKSLHVIVKYVFGGSTIFRARSEPILFSGTDIRREVSIGVKKADQTLNFILKDSGGNTLPNGTITIWGETFQADSQGKIIVSMPTGSAEATFAATGFQGQSQAINFSPNSPTDMELGLGPLGSVNRSPLISMSVNASPTVTPNAPLKFSAQGFDPDGDLLTYSWTATLGTLASASTDGTAMTWTAPNYDSIATVTVSVSDGKGGRSAASMRVTIGSTGPNRQPVIAIVASTTNAIFGQIVTLAASGTDLDADSINYTWSADSGTLSSTTGTLVQWQAPVQPATATISLSGSDGRGGFGQASLQIFVARGTNNAPTVQIQTVTTKAYPGQVLSMTAIATDSDGDVLSYVWSSDVGTIVSPTPDKASWTAPLVEGTAVVTCTVSDGFGGITANSKSIQVVNSPPIIELISTAASALPSQTLKLTASGTGQFEEALTYSWSTTGGALSSSTGLDVFWTAPGADGVATVSVLADGGGGRLATASRTFFVGNNQSPTANVLASTTLGVSGLDIPIACIASDPNGDFLTYSWTATGGSFLNANQAVTSWVAGTGPATFTLSCNVSDGRGGSVTAGITIGVLPGKNLAIGEVAHFPVNSETTIYLGTPAGNESFGVLFYPLKTTAGNYRFDVNGGGALLPDIQASPQDSLESRIAEAQSKIDEKMRNREAVLGNQIRSSIQYSIMDKIRPAETVPGDTGAYRFVEVGSDTYTNHTFTLMVVGTYCKIFLDSTPATDLQGRTFTAAFTTQAMMNALGAEFDSKIFNFVQNNYGRTWDKNGDGKISIFLSPAVNAGTYGLMGFFNPEDFTDSGDSNKRDCFYLCVYDPGFFPTPEKYSQAVNSTLVHEFQHLVNFAEHTHFVAGTAEQSWLTEGLSVESEMRYTGSRVNLIDFYASAPENVSIANWEQQLANYGGEGLFARYLFEQVGTSTIKSLVQSNLSGVANIDNRLSSRGGFNGIFPDWAGTLFRWGKGLPPNATYDYILNVAVNLSAKTHTRYFGDLFSGNMKSTALRMIKYLPPGGFTQKITSLRVKDVDNGQMGVTIIRLNP